MNKPALPNSVQQRLRDIGRACALARAERGWTQAQLAQRGGVSQRTVAEFERGGGGVAWGTAAHIAWLLELPLLDAAPAVATHQGRPHQGRVRRSGPRRDEADLDF
ncbi:MAG: helix-turn-helix domain-containing protein [Gammaproteobacteria bacterium]|nr:helix-turn-helix domain-containing protein [Gammaproteobacteria bacterium]